MENRFVICLDIGGTHISAGIVNTKDLTLWNDSHRVGAVDSLGDRSAILQEWGLVISEVLHTAGATVEGMIVSIPGPFDYEKGVCLMDGMHKYQALLHADLKNYFSQQYNLPTEHIWFFNDALSFLMGEVFYYNLSDKKVVGLTLGTGLGSAEYHSHQIRDLNYGSASFRNGIAEDYISTRGMISFLNGLGVHHIPHVKALIETKGLEDECRQVFDYLSKALIDFIEQYIILLNPDCIVLGGSIAQASRLFLPQIQQAIAIPIQIASFDERNLFFGLTSSVEI
ncbi:ROK family protein [Sphingobacterium sp. SRCM116780]|uniref:ROK family protein n=1 Tax=Sphingobacterium sp. SRCM116780 TaxID=2907623 RepID=UPI001F47F978|nr:ROK family protein [Sphingobacterium sp. SRCM116780]UIR54982.1 ROK family protein [Sphingobacterium sp. SRCM116780]